MLGILIQIVGGILLLGCLCLIGYGIYFCLSPMPVVRMLRKGGEEELHYPEGAEAVCKENVILQKDLEYPSRYGRNRMDIYMPKHAKTALPVILWVHGGAFVAGDKSGLENWGYMLAAEGFCVVAMDYQWAPEAQYPAQVEQMEECCRELKRQTEQGMPFDMERVILAGDSAGAQIAAQFTLLHTTPGFAGKIGLKPVLRRKALKGMLLYCGPYHVGQMAKPKNRVLRIFMHRIGWSYLGKRNWRNDPRTDLLTIENHVTKEFPPCYITDGNTFSFEEQGKSLAGKLEGLGVCVQTRFFEKENGQVNHEYQADLSQENGQLAYQDTMAFLREQGIGSGNCMLTGENMMKIRDHLNC